MFGCLLTLFMQYSGYTRRMRCSTPSGPMDHKPLGKNSRGRKQIFSFLLLNKKESQEGKSTTAGVQLRMLTRADDRWDEALR